MRNTKEPLPSSLIEPFLLKEHAVAQYLTVSVAKIRVMRRTGEGPPFIRIGKSIRYTIASLQDYILSLSKAPKLVRVEPKPIKQLAQKSIDPGLFVEVKRITNIPQRPLGREEITYNPLIDPNKEVAQKILLQDIFMPAISEIE